MEVKKEKRREKRKDEGEDVGTRRKKRIKKSEDLSAPPTWQRAAHGVGVRHKCQRHRGHKVVGHRLSIVLHLRAEYSLAHKVDGAHYEERHHHRHDGADGLVWRGRRLVCRH